MGGATGGLFGGGPFGNTKILTSASGAAIVGTEGALASTGPVVGI